MDVPGAAAAVPASRRALVRVVSFILIEMTIFKVRVDDVAVDEVRLEAADRRDIQDRKLVYIQISMPIAEEYSLSIYNTFLNCLGR